MRLVCLENASPIGIIESIYSLVADTEPLNCLIKIRRLINAADGRLVDTRFHGSENRESPITIRNFIRVPTPLQPHLKSRSNITASSGTYLAVFAFVLSELGQ
jgi:hypothetical protein